MKKLNSNTKGYLHFLSKEMHNLLNCINSFIHALEYLLTGQDVINKNLRIEKNEYENEKKIPENLIGKINN